MITRSNLSILAKVYRQIGDVVEIDFSNDGYRIRAPNLSYIFHKYSMGHEIMTNSEYDLGVPIDECGIIAHINLSDVPSIINKILKLNKRS